MEEFRAGLSSEATKENEELKKQIKKMEQDNKKVIEELDEEIKLYKGYFKSLTNRCFAQTNGLICMNCMIPECKYHMGPEIERAAEYMSKHHLPRNKETLKKMNELMNKWWKERVFGKDKSSEE